MFHAPPLEGRSLHSLLASFAKKLVVYFWFFQYFIFMRLAAQVSIFLLCLNHYMVCADHNLWGPCSTA